MKCIKLLTLVFIGIDFQLSSCTNNQEQAVVEDYNFVEGIINFYQTRGYNQISSYLPDYFNTIERSRVEEAHVVEKSGYAPYYNLLIKGDVEAEALLAIKRTGQWQPSLYKDGLYGYMCNDFYGVADIEINYSSTTNEEQNIKVGTYFRFYFYEELVKESQAYKFAEELTRRIGVSTSTIDSTVYASYKQVAIVTTYNDNSKDLLSISSDFIDRYLSEFAVDVAPYYMEAQRPSNIVRSFCINEEGMCVEPLFYENSTKTLLISVFDPYDHSGEPPYDAACEYLKNCFDENVSPNRYIFTYMLRNHSATYINIYIDGTEDDLLPTLNDYSNYMPDGFVALDEPYITSAYWEADFVNNNGLEAAIFTRIYLGKLSIQIVFDFLE